MLNENENLDNLEIVVRDKAALPAPKAEVLPKWAQERLADDAPELYKDFMKSLKIAIKPRKDKDGNEIVNLKAVELVADILKMRDQGGININQNFGGNTTIHNNGPSVSFEDLVRRQQARNQASETIIDAEVINEEENKQS